MPDGCGIACDSVLPDVAPDECCICAVGCIICLGTVKWLYGPSCELAKVLEYYMMLLLPIHAPHLPRAFGQEKE